MKMPRYNDQFIGKHEYPGAQHAVAGAVFGTTIWVITLAVAAIADKRGIVTDDLLLSLSWAIGCTLLGCILACINTRPGLGRRNLDLLDLTSALPQDGIFKLRIKSLKKDIDRSGMVAFALSVPAILTKIFPAAVAKPSERGAILPGPWASLIEHLVLLSLILGVLLAAYLAVMKFRASKAEFLYDLKSHLKKTT